MFVPIRAKLLANPVLTHIIFLENLKEFFCKMLIRAMDYDTLLQAEHRYIKRCLPHKFHHLYQFSGQVDCSATKFLRNSDSENEKK